MARMVSVAVAALVVVVVIIVQAPWWWAIVGVWQLPGYHPHGLHGFFRLLVLLKSGTAAMLAWLKRLFAAGAPQLGPTGNSSSRVVSLTVSAADEIRLEGEAVTLEALRRALRQYVGKDVVVYYQREHPERPASPLASEAAQAVYGLGLAIAFPPEGRTTVDIINCWFRFREGVLRQGGENPERYCTGELFAALQGDKGGFVQMLCGCPMPADSVSMANDDRNAVLRGKLDMRNQPGDSEARVDVEVRFRHTEDGWRLSQIPSDELKVP